MGNVFVNGRTAVHKGDGGSVPCPAPDVCLVPTPTGNIPTPFPNTALTADLTGGTSTVEIAGNPVATKSSALARSTGDEAGTGGGLVSGVNMGEMRWASSSADVQFEGAPAVRFMDVTQHNCNSPNTCGMHSAGMSSGPMSCPAPEAQQSTMSEQSDEPARMLKAVLREHGSTRSEKWDPKEDADPFAKTDLNNLSEPEHSEDVPPYPHEPPSEGCFIYILQDSRRFACVYDTDEGPEMYSLQTGETTSSKGWVVELPFGTSDTARTYTFFLAPYELSENAQCLLEDHCDELVSAQRIVVGDKPPRDPNTIWYDAEGYASHHLARLGNLLRRCVEINTQKIPTKIKARNKLLANPDHQDELFVTSMLLHLKKQGQSIGDMKPGEPEATARRLAGKQNRAAQAVNNQIRALGRRMCSPDMTVLQQSAMDSGGEALQLLSMAIGAMVSELSGEHLGQQLLERIVREREKHHPYIAAILRDEKEPEPTLKSAGLAIIQGSRHAKLLLNTVTELTLAAFRENLNKVGPAETLKRFTRILETLGCEVGQQARHMLSRLDQLMEGLDDPKKPFGANLHLASEIGASDLRSLRRVTAHGVASHLAAATDAPDHYRFVVLDIFDDIYRGPASHLSKTDTKKVLESVRERLPDRPKGFSRLSQIEKNLRALAEGELSFELGDQAFRDALVEGIGKNQPEVRKSALDTIEALIDLDFEEQTRSHWLRKALGNVETLVTKVGDAATLLSSGLVLHELIAKRDTRNTTLRTTLQGASAAVGTLNVFGDLAHAHAARSQVQNQFLRGGVKELGKLELRGTAASTKMLGPLFGAFGGAISVGSSGLDLVDTFQNKDFDASAMHLCSVLISGAEAVGAGYQLVTGAALMGGPVLLGLALASAAAAATASYLTESPLEQFGSTCWLGQEHAELLREYEQKLEEVGDRRDAIPERACPPWVPQGADAFWTIRYPKSAARNIAPTVRSLLLYLGSVHARLWNNQIHIRLPPHQDMTIEIAIKGTTGSGLAGARTHHAERHTYHHASGKVSPGRSPLIQSTRVGVDDDGTPMLKLMHVIDASQSARIDEAYIRVKLKLTKEECQVPPQPGKKGDEWGGWLELESAWASTLNVGVSDSIVARKIPAR